MPSKRPGLTGSRIIPDRTNREKYMRRVWPVLPKCVEPFMEQCSVAIHKQELSKLQVYGVEFTCVLFSVAISASGVNKFHENYCFIKCDTVRFGRLISKF